MRLQAERKQYKYTQITTKEGKRLLEHRVIMVTALGRPLSDLEEIHHINGNTTDNRISNLQLMTKAEHRRLHHLGKRLERYGLKLE